MEHKITNRSAAYKGSAFNVEILEVNLPDGRKRNYDLVDHNNSVTMIPFDADGNIYFVKQYRMGSESKLLELPAGVMEKHESPRDCAARELQEEIGMAAGDLTRIGAVYLAPGYSNELNFIFLAKDLKNNPLEEDDDEFISIHAYSPGDVTRMIRSGDIRDSKSLAALHILAQRQENN